MADLGLQVDLRGVRFLGAVRVPSIIHGKAKSPPGSRRWPDTTGTGAGAGAGTIFDVAFVGLAETGRTITAPGAAFEIDPMTTSNVTFR